MNISKTYSYLVVPAAAIIVGMFIYAIPINSDQNDQSAAIREHNEMTEESGENQEGGVVNAEEVEKEEEEPLPTSTYLEVIDSCGPYYDGECLNARTSPSASSSVALQLRTGMVLAVEETIENEGRTWHKIAFNEWIRYPERVRHDWYVAGDFVRVFDEIVSEELTDATRETKKRIVIDQSEQMLYAYDDDELFMKEPISTGLALTPTPRGTFNVFRKTPSRYMQGPLPGISNDYYDLPGVPWNLYFTEQGAVIHGAYWHDHFGSQWSHGCVNLPPQQAEKLYHWADIGTTVIVQD